MNGKSDCKNKMGNFGFVKRNTYLFAICFVFCLFAFYSRVNAEERQIDFTCYIDKGTCFTGCQTRKGIAAADEAHIGYTAIVYTTDYELIGIYEVLDKIGTDWGRKGNCIDIWCESLDEAKEMMKLTNGKCIVQYVWAEG